MSPALCRPAVSFSRRSHHRDRRKGGETDMNARTTMVTATAALALAGGLVPPAGAMIPRGEFPVTHGVHRDPQSSTKPNAHPKRPAAPRPGWHVVRDRSPRTRPIDRGWYRVVMPMVRVAEPQLLEPLAIGGSQG